MEYLIRPCEPKDLASLVSLCEKHAAYERAAYSSEGKMEKLRTALFSIDPPLHCWVVEINQRIIGYSSYTFDYSTWDAAYFLHVDCLFLDENFRGLGIGEQIMKRLLEVAKKNECINMQWQTPAFNEKAIRFYKRMGGISKEKQRFSIGI